MDISSNQMKREHEFEHNYSHFCGTCVGAGFITLEWEYKS